MNDERATPNMAHRPDDADGDVRGGERMNWANRARKLAGELEELWDDPQALVMVVVYADPAGLRRCADRWEQIHPLVACPNCGGSAQDLVPCEVCGDTGETRG